MKTLKTLALLALCGSFSLLAGCSTISLTLPSILVVEDEQTAEPAVVASTEKMPESVQTVSEL